MKKSRSSARTSVNSSMRSDSMSSQTRSTVCLFVPIVCLPVGRSVEEDGTDTPRPPVSLERSIQSRGIGLEQAGVAQGAGQADPGLHAETAVDVLQMGR